MAPSGAGLGPQVVAQIVEFDPRQQQHPQQAGAHHEEACLRGERSATQQRLQHVPLRDALVQIRVREEADAIHVDRKLEPAAHVELAVKEHAHHGEGADIDGQREQVWCPPGLTPEVGQADDLGDAGDGPEDDNDQQASPRDEMPRAAKVAVDRVKLERHHARPQEILDRMQPQTNEAQQTSCKKPWMMRSRSFCSPMSGCMPSGKSSGNRPVACRATSALSCSARRASIPEMPLHIVCDVRGPRGLSSSSLSSMIMSAYLVSVDLLLALHDVVA
eukprot:CAMPEP_0115187816 /NCGR_PEP_ID=MMETSP0270-20121206/10689_1 /TAXON_ID=71861 /ORGANISM="Scrippsiella trochoidea, Strain CCMP3099" /LENGTH=274 /DNA_ID=CAMNT_0002600977 /DNA_START=336 /DNA_END=1161 /DNA_ORIENTATION=-